MKWTSATAKIVAFSFIVVPEDWQFFKVVHSTGARDGEGEREKEINRMTEILSERERFSHTTETVWSEYGHFPMEQAKAWWESIGNMN